MLNGTRGEGDPAQNADETGATGAHGDATLPARDALRAWRADQGGVAKASELCSCVEGQAADVLAVLSTAVMTPDREEGERQLTWLVQSGMSATDLIDIHIPQAARFFGDSWMTGKFGFAEVTIAVARLQGWLRDLDVGDRQSDPFSMDAPEVLLVLPEGCQHTLGAMVVMSRLRRLGALVRLSIGQDSRSIGRVVRAGHYDMVAISAAGSEGLDFLAKLVNSIRSGLGPAPYVVLGGEILNQAPDATSLIGADFGTSDPEEALRLCGLTTSAGAASSAKRTPGLQKMRGDPSRVSERV